MNASSAGAAQYIAPRPAINSAEAGQLLLDLNALAEGHSFSAWTPSNQRRQPPSRLFHRHSGFLNTLCKSRICYRQSFPFALSAVTSTAWSSDSKTLFYTVETKS